MRRALVLCIALVLLGSPLLAAESCVSFDPAAAKAVQAGGAWRVVSGSVTLVNCGNSQANAQVAVDAIKSYKLNSKCTAGSLQYWLVGGNAPAGTFLGETCTQFDATKLNVLQVAGQWWIVTGTKPLLGFGVSQANATEALAAIKKYGFNTFCYVGTGPDVLRYFKKVIVVSTRSINLGPISIPTPDEVVSGLANGTLELPGGVSLPLVPPGVPTPASVGLAPTVARSAAGVTIVLPPGVPVPPGFTVVSGGSSGSSGSSSNPLAPVMVKAPNGVIVPLPPGSPVPPGFTLVSGGSGSASGVSAGASSGQSRVALLPGGIPIVVPPGLPLPPGATWASGNVSNPGTANTSTGGGGGDIKGRVAIMLGGIPVIIPPGLPLPPGATWAATGSGSSSGTSVGSGVHAAVPAGPSGSSGTMNTASSLPGRLAFLPGGIPVIVPPGAPLPPGAVWAPSTAGLSPGAGTSAGAGLSPSAGNAGTAGSTTPAGASSGSPNYGSPVTGTPNYGGPVTGTGTTVNRPPTVLGPPTAGSPTTGGPHTATPVTGTTTVAPVVGTPAGTPVVTGTPAGQPQAEDCVTFNPDNVEAKIAGGTWKVVCGTNWMLDFGAGQANAQMAVNVIKHYRMNSHCFIGRPNPSFHYWLCDGKAPAGPFQGEDRIPFDISKLKVTVMAPGYSIVDDRSRLFDFPNEAQANQALAIIKKYGFTSVCYVGRPFAPFTYLRKDIPGMAPPPGWSNPPTGSTGTTGATGTTGTTGSAGATGSKPIGPILPKPGIQRPGGPIVRPGGIKPPLQINPNTDATTGATGTTGTTDTTGTSTGSTGTTIPSHVGPPRPGTKVTGPIIVKPGDIKPPLVIKPGTVGTSGATGTTDTTGTTGTTGPSVTTPGTLTPAGPNFPKPGTVGPNVLTPGKIPPGIRPPIISTNEMTFDPSKVDAKRVNQSWVVCDVQSNVIIDCGPNGKQSASKAVDAIKHYRMTSRGFIGSLGMFQIWLVNGQAPVGALRGEDSISFNPDKLQLVQAAGNWQIVEAPNHYMFNFGANQAQATAALNLIKQYGFTRLCYVGRPNPPMQYLRK